MAGSPRLIRERFRSSRGRDPAPGTAAADPQAARGPPASRRGARAPSLGAGKGAGGSSPQVGVTSGSAVPKESGGPVGSTASTDRLEGALRRGRDLLEGLASELGGPTVLLGIGAAACTTSSSGSSASSGAARETRPPGEGPPRRSGKAAEGRRRRDRRETFRCESLDLEHARSGVLELLGGPGRPRGATLVPSSGLGRGPGRPREVRHGLDQLRELAAHRVEPLTALGGCALRVRGGVGSASRSIDQRAPLGGDLPVALAPPVSFSRSTRR